MNLGELEIHSAYNRPQLQRINTSELPVTPVNVRFDDDRSPSITSSRSDAETVIRWVTPPSRNRTPESHETLRPETTKQSIGVNEAAYASTTPLVVRFDEEQIRSNEVEASKRTERMDDIDMDSNPPTPNTDDTPYIRFAIDQLTRDQDIRTAERPDTETSSDSYPVERIIPDYGLGYVSHTREELALARKYRSSPGEGRLFNFNATRPLSYHSNRPQANRPYKHISSSDSEIFIPVEPPYRSTRYPDLTFIPTILRPFSMITLSLLCLLMITALMFCAIYSAYHNGLVAWSGGIYGGRYFTFGFLPQIIAACLFLYIQAVMAAITRIMPYTMMAMDNAEGRTDALFVGLFPRSLLWPPRWEGLKSIDVANLFFWLSIFTIPLQSCLFSVIQVDGEWRWTAVQGIAWTLAAIYILILLAAVIVVLFFHNRMTGLMWDPTSLADMIALLPRSNCLRDYPGTDIMRNKDDIRTKLALRSDRLGYWRTPKRTQGIFYCLGEEGASIRQYTLEGGKIQEKTSGPNMYKVSDVEKLADLHSPKTRFRHIPWYLRDTFVIFWSVAAFILLLALIIICFLPSTAIRNGFPPLVPSLPNTAGYSPANFLYSFIPSLLGLLLYLFFQPLDMGLRKLQPWAELGHSKGATAEQSLLLDYTAALPIECMFSALDGGHYRVGIISLLSFLFILLPVLAGGLFFPLTTPSHEVQMIPNMPSFYIILAILVLYLVGLLILIPNRHQMHLPHGVDCLAEIFSFLYSSGILDDAAFRAPQSKADLVTRLMAVYTGGRESRFAFGVFRGRNGLQCLGIEKLGRRGAQEVGVFGER